MPRQTLTYDILLSCPGDVIEYKKIIEECLENFNRSLGKANSVTLVLKHWTTDSFPKSGDHPQNILNKTLVEHCDACIALFGTRFGTPTDEYLSGTQEEIEKMISSGKQVFLYFIEEAMNPCLIQTDQLDRVRQFRNDYSDRGVYGVVRSKDEFRQSFVNHVSLYFLTEMTQDDSSANKKILQPELTICFKDEILFHSNFEQTDNFNEKCNDLIEKIKSIKIITDKTKRKSTNTIPPFIAQPVSIDSEMKFEISDFMKTNKIDYDDSFFELLGLYKKSNALHAKDPLSGPDDSKIKYEFIKRLFELITFNKDLLHFTKNINEYFRLECFIENKGTMLDEDIDIIIKIKKKYLIQFNEIVIPQKYCIQHVINNFDKFFSSQETHEISKYKHCTSKTVQYSHSNHHLLPHSPHNREDTYEDLVDKFKKCADDYFIYDLYKENDFDVLKFNISKLKHSSKMFFPAHLLFSSNPKSITFEVTSKNTPQKLTFEIDLTHYN